MNLFKLIIWISIIFLFCSCRPSESAIQTAISQTQIARSTNDGSQDIHPIKTAIPEDRLNTNCKIIAMRYLMEIDPIRSAGSDSDTYINMETTITEFQGVYNKIEAVNFDECIIPAREMILNALSTMISILEKVNDKQDFNLGEEYEFAYQSMATGIAQLNALASGQSTPIPIFNNSTGTCFPPSIPGLSYLSLKTYLENLGIICGSLRKDAFSNSANCEGIESTSKTRIAIEIYAENVSDKIYLILANVDQVSEAPVDEISGVILGQIARLPYDNANPDYAQNWVMANISKYSLDSYVSDQPDEIINGVRFHMSCATSFSRCLAIGEGSGSGWKYDCNDKLQSTDENNMGKESVLPTETLLVEITPTETASPTPQQKPIILKGSGEKTIGINKWQGPALVHLKGSPNKTGIFSVYFNSQNGEASSEPVGSFSGIYEGYTIIDYFGNFETTNLEISGGVWEIELFPLTPEIISMKSFKSLELEGNGDDIIFLEADGPLQATMNGNKAHSNFIVEAIGEVLFEWDLLVNTLKPFEGIINIPEGTVYLKIQAVGPWNIELIPK